MASLFLVSAHANNLIGFCFENNVSLTSVKSHLIPILAKKDKVFTRESLHCVEANIESSRKELFEKWISRRFKIIRTYDSSSGANSIVRNKLVPQNCYFKMRRVSLLNKEQDNLKLGNNTNISKTIEKSGSQRVSRLVLTEGLRGHIMVNNNKVELVCSKSGKSNYLLDVYTQSTDGNDISTKVIISKGKELNIGEVVQDLKNSSTSLDIASGLENQKTKGAESYQYFISVQ
ncbi:hypothetical protein OAT67_01615 [Bacteriovoracaceae bacterium]|nr:hypothetical protein [Bacteriovoracaceae bacterium]